MESLVQERIQKERKESKIRHGRGENGRKDCRMRTFVYQKERSCHKRRRMMRRLVDQNYRRFRKRERRMKRFANRGFYGNRLKFWLFYRNLVPRVLSYPPYGA